VFGNPKDRCFNWNRPLSDGSYETSQALVLGWYRGSTADSIWPDVGSRTTIVTDVCTVETTVLKRDLEKKYMNLIFIWGWVVDSAPARAVADSDRSGALVDDFPI
jgi:hypothetical protein